MSRDDFARAYGLLHPHLAQGVYDRWLRLHDLGARDVGHVGAEEYQQVFLDLFWKPGECDLVPYPAVVAYFDALVDHGVTLGIRLVQEALRVPANGVVDKHTRDAMMLATKDGQWHAVTYRLLLRRVCEYGPLAQRRASHSGQDALRGLTEWLDQHVERLFSATYP